MLRQKLMTRLNPHLSGRQVKATEESGFTLVESIVAAVVVGILLVSIAPMLVISTASRIQARRVDSANNHARDFADRLKAGTLPPFPPYVFTTTGYANYKNIKPQYTGINNSVFKNITAIDGNGDGAFNGANDYVIQAIRSPDTFTAGTVTTNLDANNTDNLKILQKGGYDVLVRVYRGDAFTFTGSGTQLTVSSDPFSVYSNLSTTSPGNPDIGRTESMTSELQSTFTGGTGSNSRHKPLAIFRTNVQYNVDFDSLSKRLINP